MIFIAFFCHSSVIRMFSYVIQMYSYELIHVKNSTLKICFNPLSANFTKWSNTLKQFVGNLPPNCLSVFESFRGIGA